MRGGGGALHPMPMPIVTAGAVRARSYLDEGVSKTEDALVGGLYDSRLENEGLLTWKVDWRSRDCRSKENENEPERDAFSRFCTATKNEWTGQPRTVLANGGEGGGWHKALVVGSVSLRRRLLASRP